MKYFILIILSFFILSKINGQEFNKDLDKDSLLQIIVKDFPKKEKKEVIKMYKKGNDESKEFLLFMLSMPRSSKKEQIKNFEDNKVNIFNLQKEYIKLVPDSLIVSIEFNAANKIINTNESIDLRISKKIADGHNNFLIQKWNLEYNSNELNEMLKTIGWENATLPKIKKLLDDAKCVSIENSQITTIGFARSGMGKYFYKVFDKDLDEKTKMEFNDGCTYIFYKDNIVLEYGGGATGPQCFPNE